VTGRGAVLRIEGAILTKRSPDERQTINPLRRRMIDDMTVRGFGTKTRHD
jgi:hypothetical protein